MATQVGPRVGRVVRIRICLRVEVVRSVHHLRGHTVLICGLDRATGVTALPAILDQKEANGGACRELRAVTQVHRVTG